MNETFKNDVIEQAISPNGAGQVHVAPEAALPSDDHFGLSAQKRILQLLARTKEAESEIERLRQQLNASDYESGWVDCEEWINFKEKLAVARATYPGFDQAWSSLLPTLPTVLVEEIHRCANGPHAAYLLSSDAGLRDELSRMEPAAAVERFRHFADDIQRLKGVQSNG